MLLFKKKSRAEAAFEFSYLMLLFGAGQCAMRGGYEFFGARARQYAMRN
jgi:hypothetical protein